MPQTTSNKEYLNDNTEIDISKYPQFERNWYTDGYPEQMVRDKIGRSRAWGVLESKWDDKKNIIFKVMVNSDVSEERTISYDQVCDDYKWKSFKLSKDGLRIIGVPMTEEEIIAKYKPVKVKTSPKAED